MNQNLALIYPNRTVDLIEVFKGAPFIYITLIILSFLSLSIWVYGMLSLHFKGKLTKNILNKIEEELKKKNYDNALTICKNNPSFFLKMIFVAIIYRESGDQVVIETMKSESNRLSSPFWQKITLILSPKRS